MLLRSYEWWLDSFRGWWLVGWPSRAPDSRQRSRADDRRYEGTRALDRDRILSAMNTSTNKKEESGPGGTVAWNICNDTRATCFNSLVHARIRLYTGLPEWRVWYHKKAKFKLQHILLNKSLFKVTFQYWCSAPIVTSLWINFWCRTIVV